MNKKARSMLKAMLMIVVITIPLSTSVIVGTEFPTVNEVPTEQS